MLNISSKANKIKTSPTSTLETCGFKRERIVNSGNKGSTVSRVSSETTEKETTKVLFENRLVAIQSKDQVSTHTSQLLLDEVLNFMMAKFGDIPTALALRSVSQSLKKWTQTIDFKTLEGFNKNHQWGLKNALPVRFLQVVAQTASMSTIEDFKKASTLNMNLSPKKALEQLYLTANNYKRTLLVWNDLLQNLIQTAITIDHRSFSLTLVMTMIPVTYACTLGLAHPHTIFYSIALPFVSIIGGQGFLYSLMRPLPLLAVTYSCSLALILATSIAIAQAIGLAPLTLFRTLATATMDSLHQKFGFDVISGT